jgi:CBS domain-containing protein
MVRTVDSLAADLTIGAAVTALEAGHHRIYPVLDAQGRPVGLVSRADALRWKVQGGHDDESLGERISDAALPLLHPDDTVARAVDVMLDGDQGRLPVVDPATGVLVGLVTRKDLLQVRAAVLRSESERRAYFAPPAKAGDSRALSPDSPAG